MIGDIGFDILAQIAVGLIIAGIAGAVGNYIGTIRERKDWLRKELYPLLSNEFEVIITDRRLPQKPPDSVRSDEWADQEYTSVWEEIDSYYINKIDNKFKNELDEYSQNIREFSNYNIGEPSEEFIEHFPSKLIEPPSSNPDPSDPVYLTRGVGTGRVSVSVWVQIYHQALITAESPENLRDKIIEQTREIYTSTNKTRFEDAWDKVYPEWNNQLWNIVENGNGQPWEDIREQRKMYQDFREQTIYLQKRLEQLTSGIL